MIIPTQISNFKQLNTDFKIHSLEFPSHIFWQDLLLFFFSDTFRKEIVMENVRIYNIICHYNAHIHFLSFTFSEFPGLEYCGNH